MNFPIYNLKKTRISSNKTSMLKRKENLWGYICISPWLIGFLFLVVFPLFFSIYLSLSEWNILGTPQFIGFENFIELFKDDRTFKALYNTMYMAALNIPLGTIVALGLAMLVNQKLKYISFFRLLFYLPSVVSGISLFIVWSWIFDSSDKGLLNLVLKQFGLGPIGFITSEAWVKPSLVFMQLFLVGGGMMIFLAGLQGIPETLYESAEIDGVNKWQRFWYITIPMLSPTIFFQVTMGIIGYFQSFQANYIMTGGGPGDASLVLGLYIWRNAFSWYRMGYAAALAWILFIIVMTFTFFQFIGSKYWVYYEGGDD